MIQKLRKQGDELVLVLDADLIEQLRITEDTELHLSVHQGNLLVSPAADDYQQRFERAMAAVNERYAETFKRLAE